jgi:hypothetical protein
VLLVVEVSETTSLRRDRDIKLPIYARAGIAEAWIVDVRGERILVHRPAWRRIRVGAGGRSRRGRRAGRVPRSPGGGGRGLSLGSRRIAVQ